jgi:ATP-dependent RNA helicase DeaD
VGAIANEAGVDAAHIGRVEINADFSTVELPLGMPREVFKDLRKVWVCGQQLKISRLGVPAARVARKAAGKTSAKTSSKISDKKAKKDKKSGTKRASKPKKKRQIK